MKPIPTALARALPWRTGPLFVEPHQFWQTFVPPGSHRTGPGTVHRDFYPAELADGRQLLLPIRVLPGDGTRAVASLIINQASFPVEDALAEAMAELWRPVAADIVVGVPTLGLPLAGNLARRLGHPRMVALGTSRKFWYRDDLSEPMHSITSPGRGKTIFLDPRMLPLLQDRRVLLVDDVASTGSSLAAVLRLLAKAQIRPVGIAVAMEQSRRWQEALGADAGRLRGVLASPLLAKVAGGWVAEDEKAIGPAGAAA